MAKHQHISKILKWGLDEQHKFIGTLFGCTVCDAVSEQPWPEVVEISAHSTHIEYVENCFGCKAQTLELSTGDARSSRGMSNRAFNAEMTAYQGAIKEGLDPRTTNMVDINAAKHAADKAGKPVTL